MTDIAKEKRNDKTLDIKGLMGSRPEQITRETLDNMSSGQILLVISNDRNTQQSIPLLCKTRGYRLISMDEACGTFYFSIQR